MASNLAQFAFRNVVDNILVPAGVKVGGYPDEMFLNLDESEQEKYQCSICYLIVKDCKECENNHLFCAACIFAWTMTYGQNSDKCPVCRTPQRLYRDVKRIDRLLGDKKVRCPVDGCRFTGRLQIFLLHLHGRDKYSNADVDFESLRSRHPGPAAAAANSLPPLSTSLVTSTHRLRQSRSMLHQLLFMFQWQLELRRRSLQAQLHAFDPGQNTSDRLDEALALQVQVDELGAMMGAAMMAVPLSREVREAQASSSDASGQGASTSTLRQSNTSLFNPSVYRGNDDSDDDDSTESEVSTVVSRQRTTFNRNEPVRRVLSSNGPSAVSESSSAPRRTVTTQESRNPPTAVLSESQTRDEGGSTVARSTSSQASESISSNPQRLPLLNRETMQAPRLQPTIPRTNPNPTPTSTEAVSGNAESGRNNNINASSSQNTSAGTHLPQVSRPNSVFRSRSRLESQGNITAIVAPSNQSPRSVSRSNSVQPTISHERPNSTVHEEETPSANDGDSVISENVLPEVREVPVDSAPPRAPVANRVTNGRVRRRPSRSQSQAPNRTSRTAAVSGRDTSVPRTRQSHNESTRTPSRQLNQSTTGTSNAETNSNPPRPRYNQSQRNMSVAPRATGANRNSENSDITGSQQRTNSRQNGPTPRQIVRARRRSEIFQELMDQRRQREND